MKRLLVLGAALVLYGVALAGLNGCCCCRGGMFGAPYAQQTYAPQQCVPCQ